MTPLFARILGADFDRLPPRVRALHERDGTRVYRGVADIEAGTSPLAKLFARATSLPQAGKNVPIEVTIDASDGAEIWTRDFAGHRMTSRLVDAGALLGEKLGLANFRLGLSAEDDALIWRVSRASSLKLPLPSKFFSRVIAKEFESDGRYRFDVRAEIPIAGLLVHYRGWLDVD